MVDAVKIERVAVAKLAPANYKPKRIFAAIEKAEADGVIFKELVLGTLVGRAMAVFTGANPVTGELFKGVTGQFEFSDANGKEVVLSGKMYLPSGIDEMVFAALEAAEGGEVMFAFEVSVRKAGNAAGYSWAYKPLIDATAADPLAEMRAIVAGRQQALIAPPEEERDNPNITAEQKALRDAEEAKRAEAAKIIAEKSGKK